MQSGCVLMRKRGWGRPASPPPPAHTHTEPLREITDFEKHSKVMIRYERWFTFNCCYFWSMFQAGVGRTLLEGEIQHPHPGGPDHCKFGFSIVIFTVGQKVFDWKDGGTPVSGSHSSPSFIQTLSVFPIRWHFLSSSCSEEEMHALLLSITFFFL